MKKDLTIIFDLDGTLLNTDLLIKKSFEYVFKQYKPEYQLSEEEHLSFLGPTLLDSFKRYFPIEICEELIDCYREYNHAHHEDFVTIYPSVIETLQVLKDKGYPLAVVTTKQTQAAFIGLDLFSMRDYFDLVIGVDSVKKVKPDPEGINYVLENTKTSKAIMIGDNTSDILAGKNANIYTIGVTWSPKGTKEMEDLHPDLMIDQMDEIIEFIERID
ncbi:MAG: pyrophosphatase PpaX [Coprobacillus sp.]